MKIKHFLLQNYPGIFALIIGLSFGVFLMFSTFSGESNTLSISTKAWSDFASHIPLIRSFSLGNNFPPEYPLFPGEPIKYHFLFYAFVGYLEKIGIPIDFALNIPSVLGFVFLILMTYLLAKLIFKSRVVGLLAVIFFLFNSSLSFIYYFKDNPVSIQSFLQIPNITNFQSFAPYGEGLVSAFWNLNIYTNQRHLAISFALSLFILFMLIKPIFGKQKVSLKIASILGLVLGLSFFLHIAVFLMSSIVILFLGIFFSKIRIACILLLGIAAIIAIPQYLYLTSSQGFRILFNPGFLVSNDLTFYKFAEFWIYNLGISIVLIPLGFILANRNQRKTFVSFFSLFIVGNLIQFSPETAANHKFFNYFLLIGNMFSAYTLFVLWNKKNIFKPILTLAFFLMIFGGIIDFFPIYNDHKISTQDYKENKESKWILNNTDSDAVFLNTTYLYNPASLAGRKIFLGWPYFAWSQGYDTNKRGEILKNILGASDKRTACKLLRENDIDYVEIKIQNPPDSNIPPISNIYKKEFRKSFENRENNTSIYNINKNCIQSN